MNDVLPKPFTKEGLVTMLDKHLSHLKKHPGSVDPMGAPPAPLASAKRSLKSEDSPATSPATVSNWNSPGAGLAGVSPASQHADDSHMYAVQQHHGPPSAGGYGVAPSPMYGGQAPPPQMRPPQPPGPPMQGNRRGVAEMSGGAAVEMGDAKRQQMYGAPMGQPMPSHPQQMPPSFQRPR